MGSSWEAVLLRAVRLGVAGSLRAGLADASGFSCRVAAPVQAAFVSSGSQAEEQTHRAER